MPAPLCTQCANAPAIARKLCSACYQRHKAAGTLDQVSPSVQTTCERNGCNKAIPPGRRYGARFCSAECKNAAMEAARHERSVAARGKRRCLNPGCGKLLPADAPGKARCCSPECSVAYQNWKRAETRRAAWQARNLTCQGPGCGKPLLLPAKGRRLRTKYCSDQCKKNEMDRRWRERAPGYMREYLYGVTSEQWAAKLEEQDGRCAICRNPDWVGRHGKPHADHDHKTGRFRGILDDNCNNGLGRFKDDPLLLAAAIVYLTRDDLAGLRAAADVLTAALT